MEPIFRPSSEKTNFDATYDLEELLLEEVPLEARARRQKPREQLKEDATEQEIRTEQLHKMIETLFEPFNYTTQNYDKPAIEALRESTVSGPPSSSVNSPSASDLTHPHTHSHPLSESKSSAEENPRVLRTSAAGSSAAQSPSGTPPLVASNLTALPVVELSPDSLLRHASKQKSMRRKLTGASGDSPPRNIDTGEYFPQQAQAEEHVAPLPSDRGRGDSGSAPQPPSFSRPLPVRPQRGSARSTSMGGGVQVVLNETGNWGEMLNQAVPAAATVSSDSTASTSGKPTGMLGFLSRKKGRDRSPKAKERGVLGKEGARVVISST